MIKFGDFRKMVKKNLWGILGSIRLMTKRILSIYLRVVITVFRFYANILCDPLGTVQETEI